MSINKVFLSGNLTREPEVRYMPSGNAVLSFGIAVNERRKNSKTDEWEDNPNFFDCNMFGKRAEKISEFISKGDKVSLEGKVRWSQWEKDGQKRQKVDIVVDNIELMSKNGSNRPAAQVEEATTSDIYDEDIPF